MTTKRHSSLRDVLLGGALHQILLTHGPSLPIRLRDTSFSKEQARQLERWGVFSIGEYKRIQHSARVKREFLSLRVTERGKCLADAIREEFRQRNLAAPLAGEIDGWTCAAMREEWGHARVVRIGGTPGISQGVRRTVWQKGTRREDVKAALARAYELWATEQEIAA